jgi:hypothetical protein
MCALALGWTSRDVPAAIGLRSAPRIGRIASPCAAEFLPA